MEERENEEEDEDEGQVEERNEKKYQQWHGLANSNVVMNVVIVIYIVHRLRYHIASHRIASHRIPLHITSYQANINNNTIRSSTSYMKSVQVNN